MQKIQRIGGRHFITYTTDSGQIKSEQITPEAMRILRWYWEEVPAND